MEGARTKRRKTEGHDNATRSRKPLDSQDEARERAHPGARRHEDRQSRNPDQQRINAVLEAEYMREWLSKEDEFVLKQAKKRAAIRVREGRANPIDWLAVNLRYVDPERDPSEEDELEEVSFKLKEPVAFLHSLGAGQLDELLADLEEFVKLERNRSNREYWKALVTVCAGTKDTMASDRRRTGTRAVDSVAKDIERILLGKTPAQLAALEEQVRKKLQGNEPVDVDYWDQLLLSLKQKTAVATLARMFDLVSRAAAEESQRREVVISNGKRTIRDVSRPKVDIERVQQKEADALAGPKTTEADFESATAKLYKAEASNELEEDEELFNTETVVPSERPSWADSYAPRKPKFFNRVQTGFEWNRYNQIHFDEENLPPKIVSGYRFNLFYPDLIDVTRAPTYKIERTHKKGRSGAAGDETCLIRFVAGPPYEDVCFTIVDKDWDFSSKYDRGFKSSFDKGILQLHFKFKKIHYRK